MNNYRIFKRCPWKKNSKWPNGFEPNSSARKTTVRHTETEQQARQICDDHNKNRPTEGKGRYTWLFYEYESI